MEFNNNEIGEVVKALEYALRDTIANAAQRPGLGEQGGVAPEKTSTLGALITDFHDLLINSGIAAENGKYLGYVPGGGLPIAAVADFIAALSNRYAGMAFASPAAAAMENEAITWLRDVFTFPSSAWGTLTSGGSVANLLAVVAARSRIAPADRTRAVAYMTSHAHHPLQRALNVAGMDGGVVRHIPTDDNLRMDTAALESMIAADRSLGLTPWLVMASAGTTNTGSIDPLEAIREICSTNRLWFHVDAAYGGFFYLLDELKPRIRGIETADSLTVDPHKGLFMPYGTGAVLVRDADILRRALAFQADYLHEEDIIARSPAEYSVELTRHFRAPRIILALRHHGVESFTAAIREKFQLAAWLYSELKAIPDLELPLEPQLSIVAFSFPSTARFTAEQRNERFSAWLLPRGRSYISSTKWNGRTWLRACVLSSRTHQAEVKALVDEVHAFLAEDLP